MINRKKAKSSVGLSTLGVLTLAVGVYKMLDFFNQKSQREQRRKDMQKKGVLGLGVLTSVVGALAVAWKKTTPEQRENLKNQAVDTVSKTVNNAKSKLPKTNQSDQAVVPDTDSSKEV